MTALRNRSRACRDLLAHLATHGRLTHADLRHVLAERRHAPARQSLGLWEPLDAEWTARLARVLALQMLEPGDRYDALDLYDHLHATRGVGTLEPVHSKLYAEMLFVGGRDEDLRAALPGLDLQPTVSDILEADLLNPFRGGPFAASQSEWLAALARAVEFPDASAIRLSDEDSVAFDRLSGSSRHTVPDGPLVTVVITSYRPDHGLIVATQSILDQTWRNLEVLIVDDGSPREFRPLLHHAAGLDDRVRLVLKPVNRGTYATRNSAMELARGEFLTFQDSDDWSHPRRIELQVQPLVEDAALMGSRSRCIRATDEMVVTHLGYNPLRANASSLMIRLRPVVTRLGYFDEVRKAADSEYHTRLVASFGAEAFLDLKRPILAIIRRTEGSLSRNEFTPGWRHRSRFAYRAAYERWHRSIADGADPFMGREPARRPFPAPRRLRRAQEDDRSYDVVLAGDWRADSEATEVMLEEISALSGSGLRLGVAQMESARMMSERDESLAPPLEELLEDGTVELVLADDRTSIDLLMVRDPTVLQFPPDEVSAWTVRTLWIIADRTPVESDGIDLRYLVQDCSREARRLFGCEPLWVPKDPLVRAALDPVLADERLAAFDHPPITVSRRAEAVPRAARHPGRTRVGRFSRDDVRQFPADADALLTVYGDSRVDVTMVGASTAVPQLLAGSAPPANWRLMPRDAMPVSQLLREIDAFVYFPHPSTQDVEDRCLVQAMAQGRPVVLPHRLQPLFGDAAVYATEQEASDVVRRLCRDPQQYRRQVDRARQVVASQFSHQALRDRVLSALHADSPARTTGHTSSMAPVETASPQTVPETAGPAAIPLGFRVSESAEVPAGVAQWRHELVGTLHHFWHPATRRHRHRILEGDRLRDPYDVVLVGHPIDLERLSADIAVVASRVGHAYATGGVEAAQRYVAYLGGRFACIVQDTDTVLVLPDTLATEPCHWSMSAESGLVLASDPQRAGPTAAGGGPDEVDGAGTFGRIAPNHRLRVDLLRRHASLDRFYPFADMQPPTPIHDVGDLAQTFRDHMWLLTSLGPSALRLDGGLAGQVALDVAAPFLLPGSVTYTVVGASSNGDVPLHTAVTSSTRSAEAGVPHRVVNEGALPGDDPLGGWRNGMFDLDSSSPLLALDIDADGDAGASLGPAPVRVPVPPGWNAARLGAWEAPSAGWSKPGPGGLPSLYPLAFRRLAEALTASPDAAARQALIEALGRHPAMTG